MPSLRVVAVNAVDRDIIILPPGTRIAGECWLRGEHYCVIGVVTLADGHIEWKLDRPHRARPGSLVSLSAPEPAPPLWSALEVAADFDLPLRMVGQ